MFDRKMQTQGESIEIHDERKYLINRKMKYDTSSFKKITLEDVKIMRSGLPVKF